MEGSAQLTNEQQKWNEDVQTVRMKVVLPFTRLKRLFDLLNESFYEGKECQNYLVFVSSAILNEQNQ